MTEPLPPEQPDPGDTIPDVENDPVPEPDVEPPSPPNDEANP